MFGYNYLSEAACPTLFAAKVMYIDRLNAERYLPCSLSDIQPWIQDLLDKK